MTELEKHRMMQERHMRNRLTKRLIETALKKNLEGKWKGYFYSVSYGASFNIIARNSGR